MGWGNELGEGFEWLIIRGSAVKELGVKINYRQLGSLQHSPGRACYSEQPVQHPVQHTPSNKYSTGRPTSGRKGLQELLPLSVLHQQVPQYREHQLLRPDMLSKVEGWVGVHHGRQLMRCKGAAAAAPDRPDRGGRAGRAGRAGRREAVSKAKKK